MAQVFNLLCKEVLCWIISLHLNKSLLRWSHLIVIELEIVSSWNSDSLTIGISLIEILTNSLVVVAWWVSVLHELNSTILKG